MTKDPQELRPPDGLSVLDAWRLVTKPNWREPAPRRPVVSYAGMLLVIGLLNRGAIAVTGVPGLHDPLRKIAAAVVLTALVRGALLAMDLLPRDALDLA